MAPVGKTVGELVGKVVRKAMGKPVRGAMGTLVDDNVGELVGNEVGAVERKPVGDDVGELDGVPVGDTVGEPISKAVGEAVGETLGGLVKRIGPAVELAVGGTLGMGEGPGIGGHKGGVDGTDVSSGIRGGCFRGGVLGSQVRAELLHPSLECRTGEGQCRGTEGAKELLDLLLHPSIASPPQLRR